MNAKLKTARVTFFAWKEVGNSTIIYLPQYDVSHLRETVIRSIDQKSRLRIPNHLPLVSGLCQGDPRYQRLHIVKDGQTVIAVALDEDIRQELRHQGAKPLSTAFTHKIVPA